MSELTTWILAAFIGGVTAAAAMRAASAAYTVWRSRAQQRSPLTTNDVERQCFARAGLSAHVEADGGVFLSSESGGYLSVRPEAVPALRALCALAEQECGT